MDLASKINSYFPKELLEFLQDTSTEANKLGQRVYLVGGIVRDLLIGYPNFDLDLVTEGDAIELANRIARMSEAKLVIHPRFNTAKIKSGDFAIDIATARSETYASHGALPTVTPCPIEKDLFRRDFSINAMAISSPLSTMESCLTLIMAKMTWIHISFASCTPGVLPMMPPEFYERYATSNDWDSTLSMRPLNYSSEIFQC